MTRNQAVAYARRLNRASFFGSAVTGWRGPDGRCWLLYRFAYGARALGVGSNWRVALNQAKRCP